MTTEAVGRSGTMWGPCALLGIGLRGGQGPAGDGNRPGDVRDPDCLDRRQDARSHRDDADRSGHVDRLYTGS
jgi:hypothetical protein